MPTMPLPERPSIEQLRKQAKNLLRAVRSGHPDALALVAEHHPDGHPRPAAFTLDSAQLVLARRYGFASWPRLREHLRTVAVPPEPIGTGVLTVHDRYRVRAGRAAEADVRRCALAATGAHPDPALWRPLLTAQHNGAVVLAFATPAGPLFGELTPTTVTLSTPDRVTTPAGRARLLFHTASGTLAGVVPPEVTSLSVERPGDRWAREGAVVADGIFVLPNAFTVDPTGLVLRVDGNRTGDIVPADALPGRSVGVVDRPVPPADRDSPEGRRLGAAIAEADVPPVVDPDGWMPGVYAELTGAEQVQLARYGNLLAWYHTGVGHQDERLFVFDFTPRPGSVQEFTILGATIAATRMYYDFVDGASGTVAVTGLVNDDRVASITLRRKGKPDAEARIASGTFLMTGPALEGLREYGPVTAHLTIRDAAGDVLEELPYQQGTRPVG
jgi:hypothetical protein